MFALYVCIDDHLENIYTHPNTLTYSHTHRHAHTPKHTHTHTHTHSHTNALCNRSASNSGCYVIPMYSSLFHLSSIIIMFHNIEIPSANVVRIVCVRAYQRQRNILDVVVLPCLRACPCVCVFVNLSSWPLR